MGKNNDRKRPIWLQDKEWIEKAKGIYYSGRENDPRGATGKIPSDKIEELSALLERQKALRMKYRHSFIRVDADTDLSGVSPYFVVKIIEDPINGEELSYVGVYYNPWNALQKASNLCRKTGIPVYTGAYFWRTVHDIVKVGKYRKLSDTGV
jgi:hypothetical protein